MKIYRKIDESGLFIEDVIDPSIVKGEEHMYIYEPVPSGFYWPKWNGTQWIDDGQAPEPTPQEPTELELLMLAISELDVQRELDRTDNQVAIAELAELMIGGF